MITLEVLTSNEVKDDVDHVDVQRSDRQADHNHVSIIPQQLKASSLLGLRFDKTPRLGSNDPKMEKSDEMTETEACSVIVFD